MLTISSGSPSFARRAYSYGGNSDSEVEPAAPVLHEKTDAPAPAAKKATSTNKKIVPLKKHSDVDGDEYSILNVFAPAPITNSPSARSKARVKPEIKKADVESTTKQH